MLIYEIIDEGLRLILVDLFKKAISKVFRIDPKKRTIAYFSGVFFLDYYVGRNCHLAFKLVKEKGMTPIVALL